MTIRLKILIVILVIMIIAAVLIILGKEEEELPPASEITSYPIEECMARGLEREECFVEASAETGEVAFCDKITEKEYLKFECYQGLALQFKNLELCAKITHELEYNIGENLLTVSEDGCYWWYSIVYEDLEICKKIADENEKSACQQGKAPEPLL